MTVGELISYLAQFRRDREVCIHNDEFKLLEPNVPFTIDAACYREHNGAVIIGYMRDPREWVADALRKTLQRYYIVLEANPDLDETAKTGVMQAIAEVKAEIEGLYKDLDSTRHDL